ncbi:MAG: LPS assembly lipoprotein LptE [Alphaproteobacteria bacterium]|nr:LPS assembly lipoprotein LptE [Alphaproteobacteria bacterium]
MSSYSDHGSIFLSRRRVVTRVGQLTGLSLVTACGFRPLYKSAPDTPGATQAMAQIKIYNVIARKRRYDRLGQQMHNLLLDRLNPGGRPSTPAYALRTNLAVSKTETGLRITEEATRARLTVVATFKLTATPGGKLLMQGRERSVNSYNIADSEFATLSAEADAAERAVREISDSIKLRLGIYFKSNSG